MQICMMTDGLLSPPVHIYLYVMLRNTAFPPFSPSLSDSEVWSVSVTYSSTNEMLPNKTLWRKLYDDGLSHEMKGD